MQNENITTHQSPSHSSIHNQRFSLDRSTSSLSDKSVLPIAGTVSRLIPLGASRMGPAAREPALTTPRVVALDSLESTTVKSLAVEGEPMAAAARLVEMRLEMEELDLCCWAVERLGELDRNGSSGDVDWSDSDSRMGSEARVYEGVGSDDEASIIASVSSAVLAAPCSDVSAIDTSVGSVVPVSVLDFAAFSFAVRSSSSSIDNRIASTTINSSNSCPPPNPIDDRNVAISSLRLRVALLDSLVETPLASAVCESIAAAI